MLYFHTRKFVVDFAGLWVYNCQHGADDRVGSQSKKKIKNLFANDQNWCIISLLARQIPGTLALLGN
jgi:hypothetical protein